MTTLPLIKTPRADLSKINFKKFTNNYTHSILFRSIKSLETKATVQTAAAWLNFDTHLVFCTLQVKELIDIFDKEVIKNLNSEFQGRAKRRGQMVFSRISDITIYRVVGTPEYISSIKLFFYTIYAKTGTYVCMYVRTYVCMVYSKFVKSLLIGQTYNVFFLNLIIILVILW